MVIRALARAHRWKRLIEDETSAAEIAEAEAGTRSFDLLAFWPATMLFLRRRNWFGRRLLTSSHPVFLEEVSHVTSPGQILFFENIELGHRANRRAVIDLAA